MAEVVKFTGSNSELFTRESADGLHAGAQVIVPETHTVLLIKDGVVSEAFSAGRHGIFDSDGGFFKLKKGDDASIEFVFISKTAKLPMSWSTPSPIKTRDPITGVHISLELAGELEFRVATPKKFYLELVGADSDYGVDKLKKRILSRLADVIEPVVAETMRDERVCYVDFVLKKQDIAKKLKAKIGELFEREYGLELCSFCIGSAVIPDADILLMERKRDELDNAASTTCHVCGNSVADTAKFCSECGARLGDKVCPSCGTTLPPTAKFCSECGKKL